MVIDIADRIVYNYFMDNNQSIPPEEKLSMVRAIAAEDASLLAALKDDANESSTEIEATQDTHLCLHCGAPSPSLDAVEKHQEVCEVGKVTPMLWHNGGVIEYKIPVSWSMIGTMTIKAKSLKEAVALAEEAPLPEGTYVDDSFRVETEDEDFPKEDGTTALD